MVFTSMSASSPRMANIPITTAVSCSRATIAAVPYRKGLGTFRNAHQRYKNIPTAAASTAQKALRTVSNATTGETRSKATGRIGGNASWRPSSQRAPLLLGQLQAADQIGGLVAGLHGGVGVAQAAQRGLHVFFGDRIGKREGYGAVGVGACLGVRLGR